MSYAVNKQSNLVLPHSSYVSLTFLICSPQRNRTALSRMKISRPNRQTNGPTDIQFQQFPFLFANYYMDLHLRRMFHFIDFLRHAKIRIIISKQQDFVCLRKSFYKGPDASTSSLPWTLGTSPTQNPKCVKLSRSQALFRKEIHEAMNR